MAEERICAICGKTFIAGKYNAKYCSVECQDEGRRNHDKKNRKAGQERKKEERKSKKKRQKALVDIAVEAKKAGMTYGQYVARMGL